MEILEGISTKDMVQNFRELENNDDVCTVILKVKNKSFGNVNPFEIKLCGKTMLEWVANAVYDTKICYAEYNFGEDFLPIVKNAVNSNCKYTLVLFSDTPLFQRKTFLQIMEYFKIKGLSVLKLTRGYVFETEYLTKIEKILNPQMQYFEEEDFMTCLNFKQTAMVGEVLKNRILTYFMKNGVFIEDPSSTFIGADCQIGEGTVIKPFNQIKGHSVIEGGVEINSNNIITDSVILHGASITNSQIENSFVGKNAVIESFCQIKNNAKICDDVILPSHCIVEGVVIEKDTKVKSFVKYKAE